MNENTVRFYSSPLLPAREIRILYEDNHVLAAVKPAGIPAQEDRRGKADMLSILKEFLQTTHQKNGAAWLGLVHRLDQPTEGIMVFAKTSKAASRLSGSFRGREVKKFYCAVTRGYPDPPSGEWHDRISEQKVCGRFALSAEGKEASLAYQTMAVRREPELALLRIELFTGRSHQIRVQTSSRDLPLAGDRRYGLMDEFDQRLPSLALYATELEFPHPVREEIIRLRVDLPDVRPWNLFTV